MSWDAQKTASERVFEKGTTGETMRTNIGFDVAAPTEQCEDTNCPFHGTLSVRGQVIDGTVVSDKTARTVVVQREYLKYIPKYERYKRGSRNCTLTIRIASRQKRETVLA